MGLPVLPAFFLCTCCCHYPGAASECMSLLTSPDVSAFPDRVVGSACAMSFSRLARRSLTLRPAHSPSHLVTFYIEGFSHFVTSMTASIASGWSKSCRVGLSPTGKRRLSTAHAKSKRISIALYKASIDANFFLKKLSGLNFFTAYGNKHIFNYIDLCGMPNIYWVLH